MGLLTIVSDIILSLDDQPDFNSTKCNNSPADLEIAKRQLPESECPPPRRGPSSSSATTTFNRSYCTSASSSREYKIECIDESMFGLHTMTTNFCRRDQICVNLPGNGSDPDMALCVDHNPQLRLSQRARGSNDVQHATGHVAEADGSNFALILTRTDENVLFKAQSIDVAPRDIKNNIVAKPVKCRDCSRLNFLRSPPNSDNFGINITLPNLHDTAILHGWAWAS